MYLIVKIDKLLNFLLCILENFIFYFIKCFERERERVKKKMDF